MGDDNASQKPLIPSTPLSGLTAGGIAASLLAALGWLGSELLSLEKLVSRFEERQTSYQQEIRNAAKELDEDIDALRDRMTILERLLDPVKRGPQ